MGSRRPRGICWPNAEQELLLEAALGSGREAVEAWQRWRRSVDIEEVDAGSLRLLPLLYRNLTSLGLDPGELGKLKGIYRQSWVRNQIALRALSELLQALRGAGVEAIVLKGAALALQYYGDPAVRPMKDLDLLVPPALSDEAATMVQRLGWVPAPMDVRAAAAESHFEAEGDKQLDLHWYLLPHDRYAGVDDGLWEAAVPLEVGGVRTRALAPADQVFHVLVHGIAWNPVPQLRWIADAVTVIRSAGGRIEWARVLEHAKTRGFVPAMRSGLEYLRATFDADIPADLLHELETLSLSRLHRLEHWAEQRGPYTPLGWAPLFWCLYVRTLQRTGTRPGPAGYLRFLRSHLRARSLPTFLLLLVWKLLLTVGRLVGHAAAQSGAAVTRAAKRVLARPRLSRQAGGSARGEW